MPAMTDHLSQAFPQLALRLPKMPLADLPTSVEQETLYTGGLRVSIAIKHDEYTSPLYGGNKVRKLEYLLRRARDRGARRIATFGTVASNHALATAMHATALGFDCTCFLSHQVKTRRATIALNMHLATGTEIVRYGGERAGRVRTLREHLWNRPAWVIPMGASNWIGVVAFVNAGLELAAQIVAGDVSVPDRLYVANGTMATSAGLALGLALAGLRTEIHAVRVTHEHIASPEAMYRLMNKTVSLLNRLDTSIPADLAARSRLQFRDEFFGDGYARSTKEAQQAIRIAREQLGIKLDSTYTGKAMAALLHDAQQPAAAGQSMLFWNTYNAQPLPVTANRPADTSGLPEEFLRYFD